MSTFDAASTALIVHAHPEPHSFSTAQMATAAQAQSSGPRTMRAHIPFAFRAGSKVLPAGDYNITVENSTAAAGMKIAGNRPLSKENLWSIRTVVAMEPFITMSIEPGKAFTWRYDYLYYSLDRPNK